MVSKKQLQADICRLSKQVDYMAEMLKDANEDICVLTRRCDVIHRLLKGIKPCKCTTCAIRAGQAKPVRKVAVKATPSRPKKIKVNKKPIAKNATVVCSSKKSLTVAIQRKVANGYILIRQWRDKKDGKYKATFERA